MTSPENTGGSLFRPWTKRDKELFDMPSIESQFPVTFANGNRWDSVGGFCAICHQPAELHGSVTRPLPSVAVIEAVGLCPTCMAATPMLIRIHDDMTASGPDPRTGRWTTWAPKPSVWQRFLALVGMA